VWANVVAIFRPIDFFHDEDRVRREKELPFIWEVTVLHKIDMTAAVLLVNCPTNVQLDFELYTFQTSIVQSSVEDVPEEPVRNCLIVRSCKESWISELSSNPIERSILSREISTAPEDTVVRKPKPVRNYKDAVKALRLSVPFCPRSTYVQFTICWHRKASLFLIEQIICNG
jgi:hypothetical protein